MELPIGLACSHMMMDCPRCGFTQPKDKYCASCGLDIENFRAKPKPLMVRLAQNPNVHLSLIGILIVMIVGYIFYTQRLTVGRQVVALFNGTPLSSKDALDPDARRAAREAKREAEQAAAAQKVSREAVAEAPAATADSPKEKAAAPVEVTKVDISYWEVPRETLNTLIGTAEKIGEGNGGRSYFWGADKAAKAVESVTAGHRVSLSRNLPMESGAQIAIETPPTTPESFQFGLYFQITKPESAANWNLKWESQLVLPPPEAATPEAVASRQPVVRGLAESQMAGQAAMVPGAALLLVYEPTTRLVREESLQKAGEGPWSIFSSEEFKAGTSEWVVLVQLK